MNPSSYTKAVVDLVQLITLAWEKLQDELKLPSVAKKEFDDLKFFIEQIRDFLEKAYSKEVIDKELQRGIKRMRNFLYDSEDAIEDLLRCRSKWGEGGLASYFPFGYRAFTVKKAEITETMDKYKDNLGRCAPIEAHYGLPSNHAQSSSAGLPLLSPAFFRKAPALVGMEGPLERLVPLLTDNPLMLKVIFVHGAQGVGKTSLVAALLHQSRVRSSFKYCVWIKDLRSWELAGRTEAALMAADATIWDLTMEGVNNQHRRTLKEAFRLMKKKLTLDNIFGWFFKTKKKFSWALVLDDAGRADVFNFLMDHLIDTRPSVLVTTRVRSLKSSSKDYLETARYDPLDFEHVFLSQNDSRTLFSRQMEDTYKCLLKCEKANDALKDASDRISRRCRGLPLAIVATCKLLEYDEAYDVKGDSPADKWKKLSGSLEEELLSKGHLVDPNGRMRTLRMDHLLDDSARLFYLSIFPVDRPIRCSTMMRLWMAERFIEQAVPKKAEETLQRLLEHNVIRGKKTSYGRLNTCRVHNLLHQIIISKSKDEEFAMIVAGPVERLPENVRYLSFHSHMKDIDKGSSVKLLRSLHVFKGVHPPSLEILLQNVERLTVVDFQRHLTKEEKKYRSTSLDTFPRKILESKYLRYLSLRGTQVRNIPKDIDLAYLETLDLRDTLMLKLPKGILKLKKLRHLLVSRSNRSPVADTGPKLGVKAPSQLGDLTSLQKLCMIELKPVKRRWRRKQSKREQLLEELGKLTNLQRLGISMLKRTDVKLLCNSIEQLTKLEALRLIAAPEEKINLRRDEGNALECLQRVQLTGCLVTLPNWIIRRDSLVKLVLKGSQLTEDPLQHLGEFPWLKHLELEQAFDVSDMTFEGGKFQRLCFLGLDRFDKLASIQVKEGALPTLEKLSLARCNSLTTVPEFIITLPTKLKCLKLCGMPEEFDSKVKKFITEVKRDGVRAPMEVKFKKWEDPALEVVKPLPTRGAGIRSVLRPFMK